MVPPAAYSDGAMLSVIRKETDVTVAYTLRNDGGEPHDAAVAPHFQVEVLHVVSMDSRRQPQIEIDTDTRVWRLGYLLWSG